MLGTRTVYLYHKMLVYLTLPGSLCWQLDYNVDSTF